MSDKKYEMSPDSKREVNKIMAKTMNLEKLPAGDKPVADKAMEEAFKAEHPEIVEYPIEVQPEGRTAGVTLESIAERDNHIVDLHMMGLTVRTILKTINNTADARGWGKISSERSIHRIISNHFQSQKVSMKEQAGFEEGEKLSMYEIQKKMVEDLLMYVRERDKEHKLGVREWKPFEKGSTIDIAHKILQASIENKNYNASRMNPLLQITQNSELHMYDSSSEKLAEKKSEHLLGFLDALEKKLEG